MLYCLFLNQLKRWIRKSSKQQRQANKNSNNKRTSRSNSNKQNSETRSSSSSKKRVSENRNSTGRSSRGKIRNEQDKLVLSGLANIGDEKGWTEDDMFRRNEQMLGRKVEYDGNPHEFALKGFDGGIDPHAFHVVGGTFMNDVTGNGVLARAPDVSRLQPLFRNENSDVNTESSNNNDENDNEDFKPFFSDQGATPWGDVVTEAKTDEEDDNHNKGATAARKSSRQKKKQQRKQPSRSRASSDESNSSYSPNKATGTPAFLGGSNASGLALLSLLNGKGEDSITTSQMERSQNEDNNHDVFLTDVEITKISQESKSKTKKSERKMRTDDQSLSTKEKSTPIEIEDEHLKYLRQWVKQLPEAQSTEYFGDFRFDVGAIMESMTIKGR